MPTIRLATVATILLMISAAHAVPWSEPITLENRHGRLALGNQLHVIGHTGGDPVHSSQDIGATWSALTVVPPSVVECPAWPHKRTD